MIRRPSLSSKTRRGDPAHRRRAHAPRLGLCWAALALLLLPHAASAAFLDLYVDPLQSRLELVSGTLDVVLAPSVTLQFPLEPQTGVPGTTPGPLPGGGTSSGFDTWLSGRVLVEVDSVPSQIVVYATSTTLAAGDSGLWAPEVAGQPGAALADMAFRVQDGTLGLDAVGAIRDLQIAVGSTLSLTPDGPDAWIASGFVEIFVASGTFDLSSTATGPAGTGVLQPGFTLSYGTYVTDGRYEIVAPGLKRLTVPLATDPVIFYASEAGAAMPATVTGTLQGTLVATSEPAPEPTVAQGFLWGVVAVGWMARRRARREARR